MVSTAPFRIYVKEDFDYSAKAGNIEKLSWGVILGAIALLALFIPHSSQSTAMASTQGMEVSYFPLAKKMQTTKIKITLTGEDSFWLDRNFVANYQVHEVIPNPIVAQDKGDKIEYFFENLNGQEITLTIMPTMLGISNGTLGVGKSTTKLRQIILP